MACVADFRGTGEPDWGIIDSSTPHCLGRSGLRCVASQYPRTEPTLIL